MAQSFIRDKKKKKRKDEGLCHSPLKKKGGETNPCVDRGGKRSEGKKREKD